MGLSTKVNFSPVESNNQWTSLTFKRIQSPLEKYWQQIPTTDGLNVGKILHLLKWPVKIKQKTNFMQVDLYQITVSVS